ncbi:MAG: hypothetical protein FWD28_01615 [Treponema sp.]|nr:hypothetical protein [Treponema sp.]
MKILLGTLNDEIVKEHIKKEIMEKINNDHSISSLNKVLINKLNIEERHKNMLIYNLEDIKSPINVKIDNKFLSRVRKDEKLMDIYNNIINYILEGCAEGFDIHIPTKPETLIRNIQYYDKKSKVLKKYKNIDINITDGNKTTIRNKFNQIAIILSSDYLMPESKEILANAFIAKNEDEVYDIIKAMYFLLKDESSNSFLVQPDNKIFTKRMKILLNDFIENKRVLNAEDIEYIKKGYNKVIRLLPSEFISEKSEKILKEAYVKIDDNDIFNMIKALYEIINNKKNNKFLMETYVAKILMDDYCKYIYELYSKGVSYVSILTQKEKNKIIEKINILGVVLSDNLLIENIKNIKDVISGSIHKCKNNYKNKLDTLNMIKNDPKNKDFINNKYIRFIFSKIFLKLLDEIEKNKIVSIDNPIYGKDGKEIKISDIISTERGLFISEVNHSPENIFFGEFEHNKINNIINLVVDKEFPSDDYNTKEDVQFINELKYNISVMFSRNKYLYKMSIQKHNITHFVKKMVELYIDIKGSKGKLISIVIIVEFRKKIRNILHTIIIKIEEINNLRGKK